MTGSVDEPPFTMDSVDRFLRDLAEAPPVEPGDGLCRGEVIGGSFRVVRKLGEGGMGVVYLAHDEDLDRAVAVKVRVGKTGRGGAERMAREARAMAQLSHPNVVPIHEVGHYRGRLFIAMEYVDSGTAWEWVEAQPRAWQEILDLYVEAGRGLEAAHRIGLVHRDFKPDNVLVGADGRPRVADFGLARPVTTTNSDITGDRSGVHSPLASRVTQTGSTVGTVAYMAPEQYDGGEVDARADQFSFCVALFEALCGHRPFSGKTAAAVIHRVHVGRIRAPAPDRRVPPWLLRVLRRGLAAAPSDRFPTMGSLLTALTRKRRPVGRTVIAIAATIGGILLGATLTQADADDPCTSGAEDLASVWNDATREEIEGSLSELGKAYAFDAYARVRQPLAEYATTWGDAYRDACESTLVRREQPVEVFHKRVACLDRGRRAFVQLVHGMRSVDGSVAFSLVDRVHGLPSLQHCSDLEALAKEQALPEDPELRRTIARLKEGLAEINGVDADLEPDAKVAGIEALLDEAIATGYRPVIGLMRVKLVMARFQVGQSDNDELARSAFHDALAAGDDDLALSAVTTLVRLHAAAHPEEAHRWAEAGRALLTKIDDPNDAAALIRSDAIAYSLAGDYTRAIALFREGLAHALERGPDAQMVRVIYSDLAKTLAMSGDIEKAMDWITKATEATVDALGPSHPHGVGAQGGPGPHAAPAERLRRCGGAVRGSAADPRRVAGREQRARGADLGRNGRDLLGARRSAAGDRKLEVGHRPPVEQRRREPADPGRRGDHAGLDLHRAGSLRGVARDLRAPGGQRQIPAGAGVHARPLRGVGARGREPARRAPARGGRHRRAESGEHRDRGWCRHCSGWGRSRRSYWIGRRRRPRSAGRSNMPRSRGGRR